MKVHLSYYSSHEELLVKFKATQGKGYDMIIPSDYAVGALAQTGLLKEIDKNRLPFWKEIDPLLLGHSFDPHNRYSIPFSWEVFGLGIDKETFIPPSEPSWRWIFDEKLISYRILMINDPIEA